jgi:hypothetical protein
MMRHLIGRPPGARFAKQNSGSAFIRLALFGLAVMHVEHASEFTQSFDRNLRIANRNIRGLGLRHPCRNADRNTS